MIKMQDGLEKVSVYKGMVRGMLIWFVGWSIFAAIEIAFAHLTWQPLASQVLLLILVLYSGLGIVGGGVLGLFYAAMFKAMGKKTQHSLLLRFLMVSCIVAIILFYGSMAAYEKFFLHASGLTYVAGLIGFILFLCLFSRALYLFFGRMKDALFLLPSFLALSLSIDTFMVGVVYVNEILLPGRIFVFPLRDMIINCGILTSCLALYFLSNAGFIFLGKRYSMMRPRRKRGAAVMVFGISMTVLVAGLWYGSSHSTSGAPAAVAHEKTNVIVITMDTTRFDHLSCYGYHRETTPYLDGFAKESVLFKNAYSPSPWTLPAHASILTGMYPAKHGARDNADFTRYLLQRYGNELSGSLSLDVPGFAGQTVLSLADENTTIAELLSAQGYKTAGIISGPWCMKKFGIGQGFDFFDDTLYNPDFDLACFTIAKIVAGFTSPLDLITEYGIEDWGKSAPQVNDRALHWLENNYTHPFFLFLNYFDPHHPYSPPRHFREADTRNSENVLEKFNNPAGEPGLIKGQRRLLHAVLSKKHTLSESERAALLSLYDSEIRYLDYHLHRLFETLKRLNVYDRTMIVVTSDHGESFGEHDIMTHGFSLYEGELKVPLVIKYPSSQSRRGVVEDPVSLVDILPTIMSSLGFALPEGVQGRPWPARGRPLIAESYNNWEKILLYGNRFNRDLKALYDGHFKYIWGTNGCELYEIYNDPKELNNLVEEMPERVTEMQAALDEWLKSFTPETSRNVTTIDKSTEESLRSLGYL